MENPITFQDWAKAGDPYPTLSALYNWTRPGKLRDEMMAAGVIVRVNGRWLFNPPAWRDYCVAQVRKSHGAGKTDAA